MAVNLKLLLSLLRLQPSGPASVCLSDGQICSGLMWSADGRALRNLELDRQNHVVEKWPLDPAEVGFERWIKEL